MVVPFSFRHPKVFSKNSLDEIIESSSLNGNIDFKMFVNSFNEFLENKELGFEYHDLAIDLGICTDNFDEIIKYTESFHSSEYYFYRAYAYVMEKQYSKLSSIKLQFQMKFEKVLNLPRNALLLAGIDLLIKLSKENLEELSISCEEIEQLIEQNYEKLENELYTSLALLIMAQISIKIGLNDKVEEYSRKIAKKALEQKDPFFQTKALNLHTKALIRKGDFRKARRMIGSVLIPIEKTGSPKEKASMLSNLSLLDLSRMDYQKALGRFQQIQSLNVLSGLDKIQNLQQIINMNVLMDHTEKAEENYNLLLDEMGKQKIEPTQDLISLTSLAWLQIIQGNKSEVPPTLESAEKIAEEKNDNYSKIQVNLLRGILKAYTNNFDESIELLTSVVNESKNSCDIETEVKSLFYVICSYIERYKSSGDVSNLNTIEIFIERLAAIGYDQFIPRLLCDSLIMKGLVSATLRNTEDAVEKLLQAKKQAEKFRYRDHKRMIHSLLNDIEAAEQEEDTASDSTIIETYVKKCQEISKPYAGFTFVKTPKMKKKAEK